MLALAIAVFFVLHGLVHLLYFGQSWRLFELQPGLLWPDGSWAFAALLGDQMTRLLASASCVLAAIGFAGGGLGILLRQSWWRPVVVAAAVFSTVLFLLFWDGKMQRLDQKGAVGILINVVILVVVLVLQRPQLDF